MLIELCKLLEISTKFLRHLSLFLDFIGKEKTNYYQIRKLIDFLESLQSFKPATSAFAVVGRINRFNINRIEIQFFTNFLL